MSHCLIIILSRSEDEYLKPFLEIKNTEANTRLELQASLREEEQKQSRYTINIIIYHLFSFLERGEERENNKES